MTKNISRLSLSALKTQWLETWKTIAASILVSLGSAGFILLTARLTDNPIWALTRDPAEVQDYSIYIGILANWCALLWLITASICLFSAVLLKQNKSPKSVLVFFVLSGIFSLLLGVDDLYMLHDRIFPKFLHIREGFFYLLYFLTFAVYLIYFASRILQYNYMLFAAAFVLFVFSRIPHRESLNAVGDMLKYFGVVFWLAFFYRAALYEVNQIIHTAGQPEIEKN